MYKTNDIEYSDGKLIKYIDLNKKFSWKLTFSNSNNVWYKEESLYGTAIEALDYVDKYLHNKENGMYNAWIYKDGDWMFRELGQNKMGSIQRSKRVRKFINKHT